MEDRKRGRPIIIKPKQEHDHITPQVQRLNPDVVGEMEKRSRPRIMEEFTPILRKIKSQYGDITRDCVHFLERVCSIYQELEASNIFKIEVSRILSIYEDLKDLQHAKLQVRWLQDRVDQIVEATVGLTIAFIVKQNAGVVARKAQLLEGHRRELEFYKSKLAILEKTINKDEQGLAAERQITKAFSGYLNLSMEKVKPLVQSLVDGLLP